MVIKAKQIEELRSAPHRQKILNILNYLGEVFIESTGEGLKILIPNQMLSRLSITLAQLKAGNNSKKL